MSEKTIRVCHMTSAHQPNDDRVFHKECVSLARAGYAVSLVACGESYEEKGVRIVGVGEMPQSRRERMTAGAKRVYEKALSLDCDIYHFHDPELLPYGRKLGKLGKTVIFDVHENVAGQIMDKAYIPKALRKLVADAYRRVEDLCLPQFAAVIAATPYIAGLYEGRAGRIRVVRNYPKLDDIIFQQSPFAERGRVACYAGGISDSRGVHTMLRLAEGLDGELRLAGPCDGDALCGALPDNVQYLGMLDRAGVNRLYSEARLGLVLLKPTKNYIDSLPVKMFEYMAAGLPYVASDFPLWKQITESADCGLCVDAADEAATRGAVERLLSDPALAQEMGRRGRAAVEREYNWKVQERELLALYESLAV